MFSITVGRWYGVWGFIWYADLINPGGDNVYTTFNALTKRGALRKATRYIKRHSRGENENAHLYLYDETENSLTEVQG